MVGAFGCISVGAGTANTEDQGSTLPRVPLMDPSICRGPDGTYYLTGTTKINALEPKHADFQNNDGVRLWESKDLKEWEDVGLVWNLAKDPPSSGARQGKMWQRYLHAVPGRPDMPWSHGITAPEVHYLKDTFWITYSPNGHGTGLLKSTTGKAEDPYEDIGAITGTGGDPSLFEDTDGAVYWLWGEGWIAKMNADMTGLAEAPLCLLTDLSVNMTQPSPHDMPFRLHGPFMVKRTVTVREGGRNVKKERYLLALTGRQCRLGRYVQDVFVLVSDSIGGPFALNLSYRTDSMMIGHSGQTTLFTDAEGNPYATFWGGDERAVFHDRPGIVPLVEHAGFLRAPAYSHFTDVGPWAEIEPLVRDVKLNDAQIMHAPDGYYYLTGSIWNHTPTDRFRQGLRAFRSKTLAPHDRAQWEEVGPFWTIEQIRNDPKRAGLEAQGRGKDDTHFWNAEVHYLKGTFWWFANVPGGSMLIRSTSGRIEGPYESLGKTIGSAQTLFRDDDGAIYMYSGGAGYGMMTKMNENLTGADHDALKAAAKARGLPPRPDFLPVMTREGLVGDFDIGGCVNKIGGKYVLWSCNCIGGYDYQYKVADSIWGLWSRPRVGVPYGGHGLVM